MPKTFLPPFWIEFPNLTGIGWRMGAGEDYQDKWWDFWYNLTLKEKVEYIKQYPETKEYEGFYRNAFETTDDWISFLYVTGLTDKDIKHNFEEKKKEQDRFSKLDEKNQKLFEENKKLKNELKRKNKCLN